MKKCIGLWLLVLLGGVCVARAQSRLPSAGELSSVLRIDEADQQTRTILERAKAQVAAGQLDEAVEALRQVQDSAGGKLFKVDDYRYLPVRDVCQLQLVSLPAQGLAAYRSRVDPLAKRWLTEGVAARDGSLLEKVAGDLLASSYGDDALYAQGEIALEQGDFARARWCWERISPQLRTVEGQPLWLAVRRAVPRANAADAAGPDAAAKNDSPPKWLAYPDTDLNLADLRARLILVSILEGSFPRAKVELDLFARLHPKARGKLGGREVEYAEALTTLINAAPSWPVAVSSQDEWSTFAGALSRNRLASPTAIATNPGWAATIGTGEKWQASVDIARGLGLPDARVAETHDALLSYHPVIANDLVLVNYRDEIFAFQLAGGQPAWPGDPRKPGRIYSGGSESDLAARAGAVDEDRPGARRSPFVGAIRALGVPRFTMTVHERWLLARMGSPITSRPPEDATAANTGYLVCLDLGSQGKLKWKIMPDEARDPRWAFEGSPVCDGTNVYVAMRYNDIRPQQHVACFDLQTGALRWRQLVCAGESLAHSNNTEEITHNLLTLDHGTLYLNTNLGAVAALDSQRGQIHWLTSYPRTQSGPRRLHCFRDLNPAVVHQGVVFAAPADFEGIMALDASTGQVLWRSVDSLDDAVHLLGVSSGNLWASGNFLWALNVDSGSVTARLPSDAKQSALRGYGRGLLAGNRVYWPIRIETIEPPRVNQQGQLQRLEMPRVQRSEIHVFDAATGREAAPPIRLDQCNPPCEGGNLIAADGRLVIATPDRLMVYGSAAGAAGKSPPAAGDQAAIRPVVP